MRHMRDMRHMFVCVPDGRLHLRETAAFGFHLTVVWGVQTLSDPSNPSVWSSNIPTNSACHILFFGHTSLAHLILCSQATVGRTMMRAKHAKATLKPIAFNGAPNVRVERRSPAAQVKRSMRKDNELDKISVSNSRNARKHFAKHFAKWIKMICCRLVGRNFSKHFAHFDQWLSVWVPRLQSQSGATKNSSGCPSPGETSFAATAFHTISCDFNTLEQGWTHVISSFSSRLGGPVGRLVGSLGRPKYTVDSMATCCDLSGTSEY